jgi:hypothetical protein
VADLHNPGSRNKLTPRHASQYPEDSLFGKLARVVCEADAIKRKELHEAWEVARRARRRFKGGRVVDLACGHGLLAHVMLILDDSSPTALAVDTRLAPSHKALTEALVAAWPRLAGRVEFIEGRLQDVALRSDDVVVSAHACGGLTDDILDQAQGARARVAVLPCCQALRERGDLDGWIEGSLAVDIERATRLRGQGYEIWTQTIPKEITPKNRLLLGAPQG